jgi:hypothetical protein
VPFSCLRPCSCDAGSVLEECLHAAICAWVVCLRDAIRMFVCPCAVLFACLKDACTLPVVCSCECCKNPGALLFVCLNDACAILKVCWKDACALLFVCLCVFLCGAIHMLSSMLVLC